MKKNSNLSENRVYCTDCDDIVSDIDNTIDTIDRLLYDECCADCEDIEDDNKDTLPKDENPFSDFAEEVEEMAKEHEEEKPKEAKKNNEEEVKESKKFIVRIIEYLSSHGYDEGYTKYAMYHNQKKKIIQDNFSKKVLRKIGEVLDISIAVTYDATKFLIKILNRVLHSAVEIICAIAYKISGLFTKLGTPKLQED